MKKLLGIVVLGLLFCFNLYAEEINLTPSDLIKSGYKLVAVNQTENWDSLRYTFIHEMCLGNDCLGTDKIVTCNIALDKKKNRGTCYLIADYAKSKLD